MPQDREPTPDEPIRDANEDDLVDRTDEADEDDDEFVDVDEADDTDEEELE